MSQPLVESFVSTGETRFAHGGVGERQLRREQSDSLRGHWRLLLKSPHTSGTVGSERTRVVTLTQHDPFR